MDTAVPGALAAFVVDLAIYPLDTWKTRLQAPDSAQRFPGGRGLYTRGLWQGFLPVVIATLPSAALFFTVYENAKSGLQQANILPTAVCNGAASVLAEFAACAVLVPAETIKQRRQIGQSGPAATVSALTSQDQLRGLRRGYIAMVARNVPVTAIHFPLYERFRAALKEQWKDWDAQYVKAGTISALSGGASSSIAAALTTPLDVAKTRTMLATAPGPLLAEMTRIAREEGVRALFRGGLFRCAWSALGAGIYLAAYDTGKTWWLSKGKKQVAEAVEAVSES